MTGHLTLRLRWIVAAFAFLALAGCGNSPETAADSSQKPVETTKKSRKDQPKTVFDALSTTSVIARVDGQDITKADMLAWWDARVKMSCVGRKVSMNDTSKETKNFRKATRDRSLAELVRNAMISSYATKEGITPDPKRIKAAEKRIMSEIHKPKMPFAEFAKSLGPESGAMFTKMIHADALSEAVIAKIATNDIYHITEDEYTNHVAFIKAWNERADATNEVVRARAMAVRQEILDGGQFDEITQKYADFAPEQGREWRQVQLDDFDGGDPLGTWLARSDIGDISEPLELDDGISIVGLRMKFPGEKAPDGSMTLETYDIVRCAFHAFEKVEDYGWDKQSIIDEMLEARRKELMLQLREKLAKECKIEFPSGNNLFDPIKKKSKHGKAGKKPNVGVKKAKPGAAPAPAEQKISDKGLQTQGEQR